MEESLPAEEGSRSDNKSERASSSVSRRVPLEGGPSPSFLKELVSAVVQEVREHIFKAERRFEEQGAPPLTLLNLQRCSTAPSKPRGQCPAYGSEKVIPDVSIRCRNSDSEERDAGSGIPNECLLSEFLADICGDCGHVELKVKNSQDFCNGRMHLKKDS